MNTRRKVFIQLAVILLVVGSCSSTKLTTAWKDETYLYLPAKKLFVVGAFSDAGARRLFESMLVAQLAKQGTEAVASHIVFSGENIPDHEAVMSLMKERQCDFVLVTLFRGKKTAGATEIGTGVSTAPQDFSALWRDYYQHGYTAMPPRSQEREIYGVETDLYETGEERPIWKSGGELVVNGPVADQYERFGELLVGKLRTDKMVR